MTTPTAAPPSRDVVTRRGSGLLRGYLPGLVVGTVVLLLGLLEIANRDYFPGDPVTGSVAVVVGVALAVALARRQPALALSLTWLTGFVQVASQTAPLVIELSLVFVAFACARWGRVATVMLSAVSIPLAAVLAVALLSPWDLYYALRPTGIADQLATRMGDTDRMQVAGGVIGIAILGLPWVAGLAARFADRARRSRAAQVEAESARDQAEEIARLREDQTRLARDVHDVVGHSLTVVVAQAESGQYLDDPEKLQQTLATIATAARSSLDDVRHVLGSTGSASTVHDADLDRLIDGVRVSGQEITSRVHGPARPLPPDLAAVAYRVLQEMLTNALRHGDRSQAVEVERFWADQLCLRVRNARRTPEPAPTGSGQGVEGMRRRLAAVGGLLAVEQDSTSFTATAWLPVRPL
ncbi:histidine kinase [Nocardioides sp. R-C-SC26]|uniref:sensor histidine kinase n=1 Tax=Nocardioides sp. R-C-SC26 TaxID=2870414 RepID=UPI001E3129E9|nr:histidine kinase [Nocardioides sp. R-C-SC26]